MALNQNTHEHLQSHHRDFDHFANLMVDTHQGRFDNVFWAFLEQHCPHSVHQIIDLGTGPGLLLRDLSKRFVQSHVYGVEGQPMMIEKAKEVIPANNLITLIEQDLSAPPISGIKAASCDLIINSMVLHEMPNPLGLLEEMKRILAPRGVIIFYDWIRFPLARYFGGNRPTTLDQITHFSEHCRLTSEDTVWLFESSGFKIKDSLIRHHGKHILLAAEH